MPITGEIAGIPKKYALAGGGLVIAILGVVWYRSKKAAQNSSNANVTDPAGNTCTALDPNSGYCPGTPQDLAYQSTNSVLTGENPASSIGGQIIGYDQYGNPIYSSAASNLPNTGPGSYTNNAEWTQAAQQYLTQAEPNADPAVIATALGLYITGKAVSATQAQIVDQAIAFQGIPPVSGPNGDPPGVITSSTGGTSTTSKPTSAPTLSVTPYTGFADFGWSTVSGATTYNFQVDNVTKQSTSATHMEHLTLAKGKHTARVAAVNSAGSGPWSAVKSFTVK